MSSIVGLVLLWAAWMLPWRDWTLFALVTMAVAAVHGVTALAFAAGAAGRGKLWRVQAIAALSYQAWLTWSLIRSAVYVAEVYGGMGKGIAAGLLAIIAVLALLLVPTSVWALAATGGVRLTKAGRGAAAVAVLLAGWGLFRADAAATLQPVATEDRSALQSLVAGTVHPPTGDAPAVSLMRKQAVECPAPPAEAAATVFATFVGRDVADQPEATSRCLQGADAAATLKALDAVVASEALAGPIKIDIVTGTGALEEILPVVDALSMRPGLDGVCEGTRCLMPWQLFAIEAFSEMMPFPTVPDFRFGVDPVKLRAALVWPDSPQRRPSDSVEGLVRLATASFVIDDAGDTHALRRLRVDGPALTAEAVGETMANAEGYLLDAQLPDGRFKYKLHPMTGQVTQHGFSLARQAGTSLVICELAQDRAKAKVVATKALDMLVSTGLRSGDVMGLAYPIGKEHDAVALGNTALASIALLTCRDLVGDRFDEAIGAMGRFLLTMQREDGGFNPKFSLDDGAPVPGADPLFAVGQAVYALSLLERLTMSEDIGGLPSADRVREAVQRSMDYTANEFWHFFGRDFFWVEENWHCLAARASLQHHRHDGYERFCLEYSTFKARLVLDESSEVDRDYVGGVNIGNLNPPQTTATSGLSEAMAAAGAIARFREEDSSVFERALSNTLPFVMHNQWRAHSCFACTKEHRVVGAFSEHMASPQIRIDYVQHALASLGHGGRILGLVEGSSLPAALP